MPDDFTLIRGISQKTATRLHEAGILTYEKLAAMSPEEIVSRIGLGSGITAETISKKDWIGQAAKLTEAVQAKEEPAEAKSSTSNLHAMNYVVELFLEKSNEVSRTKMRHVQSGEEEEWPGWNELRLKDYFLRRSELNLPKSQQEASASKQVQSAGQQLNAYDTKSENKAASTTIPGSANGGNQNPPSNGVGKPRLQALEIIPEKIGVPCRAFAQNQPFNVRLNLDMTDVATDNKAAMNYSLTIQARSLTNEGYETVTKGTGLITPSRNALLELQAAPLLPGVYQFAAALTLNSQTANPAAQQRQPTALFKGGLFEVY